MASFDHADEGNPPNFFNVYLLLRQRDTEREQGRGRERGDTESEVGSRL